MNKVLSTILILLSCSSIVHAQTEFGMWGHITLEKELSKKFEIQVEEEARFSDNLSNFNRLLTEFSGSYKANKYYKLGVQYRFTYYLEGAFGNRLTLSNKVKYKLNDFTLNYRLNLQTDFNTQEAIAHKIRNKIGVDYKFNKRWEMGIAAELFYSFYYYGNMLDRYRLSFGVDYKLSKRHSLGTNLIFQQELNVAEPEKDFILSLGYKYSFK